MRFPKSVLEDRLKHYTEFPPSGAFSFADQTGMNVFMFPERYTRGEALNITAYLRFAVKCMRSNTGHIPHALPFRLRGGGDTINVHHLINAI